jgi:hypothetical protein
MRNINNQKTVSLILIFLFSIFYIISCGDDSTSNSQNQGVFSHDGENMKVGLIVPEELSRSEAIIASLQAKAIIDGKTSYPLSVDSNTNQVSGIITGVPVGTHEIEIIYFISVSGKEVILCTYSNQIIVNKDAATTITIIETDLDSNIDDDNDGYTNLTEVKAGRNPLSGDDFPNYVPTVITDFNYLGGVFIENSQTVFTYDLDLLASKRQYDYDSGAWKESTLTTYEYDDNRTLLFWTIYSMYNGAAEESQKQVYSYDPNGKTQGVTVFTWQTDQKVWQEFVRVIFTRNASGDTEYYTVSVNFTDVWELNNRRVYSYNPDGSLESYTDYLYDNDLSIWEESQRWIYTYNSIGLVESETEEYYDGLVWQGISRSVYTYNAKGKIERGNYYDWDSVNWVETYRRFYTYDDNDQIISSEGFEYNTETFSWVLSDKDEYVFQIGNTTIGYFKTVKNTHSYPYDWLWLFRDFGIQD